jgi:hypothetical protein
LQRSANGVDPGILGNEEIALRVIDERLVPAQLMTPIWVGQNGYYDLTITYVSPKLAKFAHFSGELSRASR